ncbi:hypothetical protein [Acinetobacter baumannii]|uniref:hypothetical protein n=1 Tax=Acinetobacter baumannii TaxID=470 RepID=UPI0001F8AE2A|nr:hypothetical protein [Acinetobacter baumannii]ADX03025.1 Hypothetical protein ABK1_1391 [Acinetobacter baumannii 1656-2]AOP63333.1 hypothetical protein DU202_02170 [Acinetobacter baumannii DU202]RQL51985.1 hypothetical protein BJI61_00095 [Acinetobacter baumannii]RSP41903.1 hypothetical protein EA733_06410 [Acinetobacter baumannii]
MGLNIQLPDVVFTKHIGNLIPSGENLEGYWLFNGTLEESIINRVTGVQGTVVGTPQVSNSKITTDKANGFITDIIISGEKTFVVVAKFTTQAILLSSINYDASSLTNEGIAVYGGKPLVQLDSASRPSSAYLPDLTKVHFVSGSLGLASNSLFVSSDGVLTEEIASHTGSLNDSAALRIGAWGVNSTSIVGSTDTYAALIFNKKLSSTETQELYEYLSSILPVNF